MTAAPRADVYDAPIFHEVFSAAPTALLLIDPAGRLVEVNSAAEMLLNASATALHGKRLSETISLPASFNLDDEGAFAAYDIALETAKGARFRSDFLVSSFADRPGWRLVSLQAGAAAHRMGHSLDRGQTKAAVRVAAMLAHEIKNPLAGIRGAAQLLSRSADASGERLTLLIRDEVDRVTALIDRMEGFTDERPLECKPENVHAIIDHARSVAQSGFGDALEIVEQFDPSLPPVLVHRDSLVQIILNLLKNAAETVEDGGRRRVIISTAFRHGVSIASETGNRKVALPIELSVMDDGPGAPADLVENLFDPFVSNKAKGHGLGLALVDKLVRDMGGIVQYERSERPEMTIFRLLLPRTRDDEL